MQWSRKSLFIALALIAQTAPAMCQESSSTKFLPNSSLLFGPGGLESTNAKPQYNFSQPAPVQYAPTPVYRAPAPAAPQTYAPEPSAYSAPSAGGSALPDQHSLGELDALRQAAMKEPPAPDREPAPSNDSPQASPGMDMNALKQAAQAMQAAGQNSDSTANSSGSAPGGIPGLGDLSKMGLPADLGSLLQGLPEKIQKFNDAYKEVDKELQND